MCSWIHVVWAILRQNRSKGVTSRSVGEKNKESHRASHRKDMSPLTQGLNYRSACDTRIHSFIHSTCVYSTLLYSLNVVGLYNVVTSCVVFCFKQNTSWILLIRFRLRQVRVCVISDQSNCNYLTSDTIIFQHLRQSAAGHEITNSSSSLYRLKCNLGRKVLHSAFFYYSKRQMKLVILTT